MTSRTVRALGLASLLTLLALPLAAAPHSGKLAGVVVDLTGTPQMGATVIVAAEQVRTSASLELLTNDRGHFAAADLLPGLYTVRVTLAGFLPAINAHIRIEDQQTTLLQIELGSVFASFDRIRRLPNQTVQSDDWGWVLRTSPATRPVLRFADGQVPGQLTQADEKQKNQPRSRLELTSGGRQPGSISNIADASPSTAFAYDLGVGGDARLLLAGQFSYENSSSGGFATTWLPTGDARTGPVTSLVARESKLGPDGPTFRGLRLKHDGQLAVNDRISVRYGGDSVVEGYVTGNTMAVRPHGEVSVQLTPTWHAALLLASNPWQSPVGPTDALASALSQLDDFPTLLVRDNRSELASDWHQELAVDHRLGSKASVTVAGFHDSSRNTALFGRGNVSNPDYVQDFYSDAFAYDGGSFDSWGARVAYRQKITESIDATLVYAFAGALAPDTSTSPDDLRDSLENRYRSSFAARVSSRVSRFGTQLSVSYKWIDGQVVSRQDAFGESLYLMDPFLNISFRQPLPSFLPCRMTAMADFGNLLAQGYVPITTRDGQVLLVPAFRSFRGGLSVQF